MPTHSAAPVTRSGFRPWNTCRNPSPSVPMSRSALTRTSSKKRVNCRSGRATDTASGCAVRPRASVSDDEQREGRGAGALVGAGPGDDEDGVGLIDAGDVILL